MQPLKDLEIYQGLRRQILQNDFRPGDRLIEEEICRQFSVTRTPVRHALRRLEQEGFLVAEPYAGCRVREISITDVQDLFDIREMLEGLAARNVALRGNPVEYSILAELAAHVDLAASAGDWRAYFEADKAFHERLVEISGNSKLVEILQVSSFQLRSFTFYDRYLLDIVGHLREIEATGGGRHRELADALATEDADHAERALRNHIRTAKQLVNQALPGR